MKKICKLLIGTNNRGKYKEIRDLLPKHIKTYSTSKFKLKSPKEDGKTFEENSIIKSKHFSKKTKLKIEQSIIRKISSERAPVNEAMQLKTPVYGLNTGLGGNLAHELNEEDVQEFQEQLIKGRAVAVGESFSEEICRGVLLARILSAREGQSGISVEAYKYLIQFWNKGLSSTIPRIGSIGAGDLTQNAHFALGLIGLSEIWSNGRKVDSEELKSEKAYDPLKLKPKDGLALINHKGVSISLAAFALQKVKQLYIAQEIAICASIEAYQANISIFSPSNCEATSIKYLELKLISKS